MRMIPTTLVAVLALSAAACGRNDEPVTADANIDNSMIANDTLPNDMGTAADATMPTDAAGFANAVAASDMFEIESGKLAASHASSADVKSFAAKLQADHTKSSTDLKTAAANANVTVTPALDAEKQGMLDSLKAAKGEDFDRLFIDQQTTAHQKALQLLQNYSTAGDNDALKAFATKATAVVQGHLYHVNGMNK
jgi:putative membrane protein